jgi:bacterioferritin
MKGDAKVIEFLNKALKNELTAINQYFLHSRMLKDWGISKLAEKEYKESIEEMEHADWLIDRILFLEGLPNLQDLGKLRIGENTEEILEADLKLEHQAIPLLRDAIEYCEKERDYISRDLFQKILDNEEEHVDWIETQQSMIEKMGIQNYVQLQSGAAE